MSQLPSSDLGVIASEVNAERLVVNAYIQLLERRIEELENELAASERRVRAESEQKWVSLQPHCINE